MSNTGRVFVLVQYSKPGAGRKQAFLRHKEEEEEVERGRKKIEADIDCKVIKTGTRVHLQYDTIWLNARLHYTIWRGANMLYHMVLVT